MTDLKFLYNGEDFTNNKVVVDNFENLKGLDKNIVKMMAVSNLQKMIPAQKNTQAVLNAHIYKKQSTIMFMKYREQVLANIIAIDRQIVHKNNGKTIKKLMAIEENNCDQFYKAEETFLKDQADYLDQVAHQVMTSNVKPSMKNVLITELNNIQARYNQFSEDRASMYKDVARIAKVDRTFDLYQDLLKNKNATTASKYMFSVLEHKPAELPALTNVPLPSGGNNIFDMVADECNYLLQYDAHIKKLLEHKASVSEMQSVAPFLFEGTQGKLIHGLAQIILDKGKDSHNSKIAKATKEQEQILDKLNQATNQFLVRLELINPEKDGYSLSKRGKAFITDPDKLASKCDDLAYQPIAGYAKVIKPFAKALRWVAVNKDYSKFYGLALIVALVNLDEYKALNTYNEPELDRYGAVIHNAQGDPKFTKGSLSLSPMAYTAVLAMVLERATAEDNHWTKITPRFISQLVQIDQSADQLFND